MQEIKAMGSFRLSAFLLVLLALFSLMPLFSSARYTALSFSEEAITFVEGRVLMKVSLMDYGEPSANQGHDPSQSKSRGSADDDQGRGGGGGGANGRRGRRRKG